jgi:hypothetical protein
MSEKGNPILDTYKGHPIRKYNKIYIRVTPSEMRQFIDAREELGISSRRLVEMCAGKTAECRGIEITVWNKKKNKSITLTRGFLCRK